MKFAILETNQALKLISTRYLPSCIWSLRLALRKFKCWTDTLQPWI